MNFFPKALQLQWTLSRWLLAGFAAYFCLARAACGMDPNREMSQYVHDRWGAEQGFPTGPVYAITQTADGYLWIGTEAGLLRFDGWNFRLIKDDSGSFTMTSVLGLVADDDGGLWVRLQDLSVVRYRNGVFERQSPDSGAYTMIEAMTRANHGELLVSRMEAGAFAFRGGAFQLLASAADLPRSPVTALSQASNSDIWMGTRDAGLFRFAGGKMLSIRSGLPDLKINCLQAGGDQDLWIGTDNGIVRWDGKAITGAGIPASFGRFQALLMVRDRDGNVWVGTDSRGLLRVNSGGLASLGEEDEASGEAITALFEDREGNLWIGHAGGIERLRDSAFVTYSLPEGLPTDGPNPVYVDSENRMWFPPIAGGLWWVKDGKHGSVSNAGLDRDVVYSIAGRNGELWLGRRNGGLTQLRTEGGSFTARSYTQADGLPQSSVYSVYLGSHETVWAGYLSAGVSMLRNGTVTTYTIANGLASNMVASILESAEGTMWFGTPSGLSALSKGQWRTYTVKDGLPSDNVNCLLEDSTGMLWAGTAAGLAFQSLGRFQAPTRAPESLHEQVLGLAEDRSGSLWMSTSRHVMRVNRERLLRGALAEGDVREYGLADGLRGVEGVKRHRSVVADPAGRIWVSLNHGISVVDPARLTRNSAPAIAHIQTISADGRSLGVGPAVHIPGGRRRITLGYAGLSLSIPARVRFRYWLEGFDHYWSEPAATREAVYTNLSPGPYRFRVIASNPDGVWSTDEAAIDLEVDPLPWQTWWFRAIVAVACMIAGLAFYRLRLGEMTTRLNVRFEERLAERTRIAQELHDTLLQGFLSASMQVHVAVDRLPADSPAKPLLTRALQLMRQVIEEGRNAVRGLRSSSTSSLDLEHAFSQIQQEFVPDGQPGEGIGFRVIVEGQPRPLRPVLRDDVYRIGREALINAFRHAHAKSIELELKYSSSQLRIQVRDDGCGIDPQLIGSGRDGHWGLSGMRERADRIGSQLHVWSSAAGGTEIEIVVPSHIAFQDHRNRTLSWFGWHLWPRPNGQKPKPKNGAVK